MSAPVFYIPHGGGPMPLLGDANHASLIKFLQRRSYCSSKFSCCFSSSVKSIFLYKKNLFNSFYELIWRHSS